MSTDAEYAATLSEPSWIARCSNCGHPTGAAMYDTGEMPWVRRWIARGDDVALEEAEAFRRCQTCECKRLPSGRLQGPKAEQPVATAAAESDEGAA